MRPPPNRHDAAEIYARLMITVRLCSAVVAAMCLISPHAHATQVFGLARGNPPHAPYGQVFIIDTESGETTLFLDTHLAFMWQGATSGDNERSFFATGALALFRIDVQAMSAHAIGSYGGPEITELAYDEDRRTLFGNDYDDLYEINVATGAPRFIGALGVQWMFAMDYDPSIGQLVGFNHEWGIGRMYYIDVTTGTATAIGPQFGDQLDDLWFDHESGKMFAVNAYPTTRRLYEVDTATGEVTFLAALDEQILGLGKPLPGPVAVSPTTWGEVKTHFGR